MVRHAQVYEGLTTLEWVEVVHIAYYTSEKDSTWVVRAMVPL